jgi:hypothetical protein
MRVISNINEAVNSGQSTVDSFVTSYESSAEACPRQIVGDKPQRYKVPVENPKKNRLRRFGGRIFII